MLWEQDTLKPRFIKIDNKIDNKIDDAADREQTTAKAFKYLLDRCRVYHFHDTSATAGIRQSCYQGDNRWLVPDAGNLAGLLLRFQQVHNGS